MPGFNEEIFPFFICRGHESINLINVRDFYMEKLVKECGFAIGSIFSETDYGFKMHFTGGICHEENIEQNNWHCMIFKEDFIEKLKRHGRLPISSVDEQYAVLDSNQSLQEENNDLKEQIEQLKKQL